MRNIPRNRGIHVVAGSGSGKSTMLGKRIAYTDFMLGVPLVIIDPVGGAIDNFLDKVLLLPEDAFSEVKDSIVYLDMSGKSGQIPQFPLWYQLPHDRLWDVADRFVRIIDRLDPQLRRAPIWGYNPFATTARHVGMVLYALGLSLRDAPNLLAKPERWKDQLSRLKAEVPDADQAVDWFLDSYIPQPVGERKRDTSTFLNKIQPIIQDRVMELMFCGQEATVDWADVVATKKAVLLDFRYEREPKFKLLWALTTFLEHVQMRGIGRNQPISLILDELSFFLNLQGGDLLTDDFDDLINRIARNNDLWLTLAHQEMYQVSDRMKDTLMSMGTQVIGYTTKQETALDFAAKFGTYNPYRIKDSRAVYRHDRHRFSDVVTTKVIDQTLVYFTAQEQLIEQSEQFRDLLRFEFRVATSRGEGSSWGHLTTVRLPNEEAGFDEIWVKHARERLATRSGVPLTARTLSSPPDEPTIASTAPRTAGKTPAPPKPRARTGWKKQEKP